MRNAAVFLLVAIGCMASSSALAEDQSALADSKGCFACHQVSGVKVVGPAFNTIARKYAGDTAVESKLVDKVINGGVGVWGSMPMHAGNVNDEDALALVQWILSLK
ncbi:MAG: c-type cytochrome [Chlorobiaceae bacterium]|nr:c-type cytochrome [Chlorobiaceae bacterium]